MEAVYDMIGRGRPLGFTQMAARAVLIFLITLILLRLGGARIFGKRSAFDTIIMITLGALLARAIVGATPLLPTIGAALILVVIHRLFSWLCYKSRIAENWIKGERKLLFSQGKIMYRNLRNASLTETDLYESLRLETRQEDLDEVESAYIETNGRISFILRQKKNLSDGAFEGGRI